MSDTSVNRTGTVGRIATTAILIILGGACTWIGLDVRRQVGEVASQLNLTRETVDRSDAQLKSLNAELALAQQHLRTANDSLRELRSANDSQGAILASLETRARSAGDSIDGLALGVSNLDRRLTSMGEQLTSLDDQAKALTAQVRVNLDSRVSEIRSSVGSIDDRTAAMNKQLSGVAEGVSSVQRSSGAAQSTLDKVAATQASDRASLLADLGSLRAASAQSTLALEERVSALSDTVEQALASVNKPAPVPAISSADLALVRADIKSLLTFERESSTALDNRMAALADTVSGELRVMQDVGAQTASTIDQRIASLDGSVKQALGNLYIAETPEVLERAVDESIRRWLPAAPPEAIADADDLRGEILSIRNSTPAGAGNELEGRLTRLEWWADVIELTDVPITNAAQLPSVLERAAQLERSAPFRAPAWCFDRLRDHRRKALGVAAADACANAFESGAGLDEARSILNAAIDLQRNNSPERKMLDGLRADLDRLFPEASSPLAKLKDIEAQRAIALSTTDPELRVQLLLGIDAQATFLLTECKGDELKTVEAKVAQLRAETAKIAKDLHDKRWLAYQKYALDRIQRAEKKIDIAFDGTNDYPKMAEALFYDLGDIDQSLLEPAVSEEYSRVRQKAWEQVTGDLRREVLRKISDTPKKQLGEV